MLLRMLLHMLIYAACYYTCLFYAHGTACYYTCLCMPHVAHAATHVPAPCAPHALVLVSAHQEATSNASTRNLHARGNVRRTCAACNMQGGATQACFKTGHPLVWKLSCGKRSPHHSQHTPEKHGDNRNEVWRRKILEHISNIMLWIQTSFRLSPLQPHVSLQDSIGQYAGVFQFHAWIH